MKFRKPVKRLNGHNVLTQTEKTIIALLAAGLTAKEIAQRTQGEAAHSARANPLHFRKERHR
jgi:DNA-binding CsgD family transcriptional regulator